jgi:hypothetical protein
MENFERNSRKESRVKNQIHFFLFIAQRFRDLQNYHKINQFKIHDLPNTHSRRRSGQFKNFTIGAPS